MKKVWEARISPLAGTERAFFEERREELRTGYEAHIQRLLDQWEGSSGEVAVLRRKRRRDVRLATFFGTVVLRCREGIDVDGRWMCPARAHLGLRSNQHFSPDMERHVVAVPADTTPHDFGVTLHGEAVRMGLLRAKAVFFVMDGGLWLWNIYKDRFEQCSQAMPDFYRLSQHLHALAAALHGSGTAKAEKWCGKILYSLRHKSPERLFRTLDDLLEEPPSEDPATLESIRVQNAYFRSHADHMAYAANAKLGVPVGSGSVESLCSQSQDRLKRTGQFWTKAGFAALLRIIVRRWNNELGSLWMASAS